MNRADRRLLARGRASGPPALCPPGTHRFAKITGTVAGVEAVTRIVCQGCRRTFQEVMDLSAADLAIYRAWLELEKTKAEHSHPVDPTAVGELRVQGCPGCERLAQLEASEPERL